MNNKKTNIEAIEEIQVQRELQMGLAGEDRYYKRLGKMKSKSTHEQSHILVSDALPKVSKALEDLIQHEGGKGKGRRFSWYEDLKYVGRKNKFTKIEDDGVDADLELIKCDELAYLGLNTFFDAVGQAFTLTATLTGLGKKIEIEHWAKGLEEFDKVLSKRITSKATKDHSSPVYRLKAVRSIAGKEGYDPAPWTEDRRIKAAIPVVNAILEHSDLFEIYEIQDGIKTIRKVGILLSAQHILDAREVSASWMEPMLSPMIVPPNPWTKFNTGGYLSNTMARHVPLIRSACREQRDAVKHQIKTQGRLDYLDAINAIQNTPLKINTYTLECVEWLWENNLSFNKFPRREKLEFLRRPADFDEYDTASKKGWMLKARAVREKNQEITSAGAVMKQDLNVANEMTTYDEFYLVWNFCFRGRMYPVSHFNYHRDDHVKSLFMLKNGSHLDQDGAAWLAVHLANCGDFNKISKTTYEDRLQWVADNHDQIIRVGEDFKSDYEWWTSADKPLQFVAACREYANYTKHGFGYFCCLPPSVDGTNSGVQHFAAASLSREDGRLVNLTPTDVPQDIYKAVADAVNTVLEPLTCEFSLMWKKFGITRKTVKRNTMTYGYSSVVFGFSKQISEDLMKPLNDEVEYGKLKVHPFGDKTTQGKAASFLAKISYKCITDVITSVSGGMKFLQSCASALAHEGKPIRWNTPVGFPVIQKYSIWNMKEVKIFLYDRKARVPVRSQIKVRQTVGDLPVATEGGTYTNSKSIDKRKAKSAVSANFIHSLDSAHMQATILLCAAAGITDFFVIHDSFAVPANDTWTLYDCVRAAFVDQYTDRCIFQDFGDQIRQQLSDPLQELAPIPAKGSLDLALIKESQFCFS